MATTKLMTADELLAMPDDGRHWELDRGVLREMNPSRYRSSKIAGRIVAALSAFVEARGLGDVIPPESGFRFERDPDVVLSPDGAFIRAERVPPDDAQDRFAEVAPDLVVEVNSPTDRPADVRAKVERYLGYGVAEIWVVDPPSRSVTRFRQGREPQIVREPDALDGREALPGFRLDLAALFR
ncbi:MAG TPA: Uma2 family endonuclease [Thermomicrobiales bacterium]|nr:Uma2 family endonuclease [Thermomicrobiales bacterium]